MGAPSGRQHVLTGPGDQRAVVVEVGGGLRQYTVDGAAVLDGYAEDQMCDGGRGQPLIPWPNRTGGGRYSWEGQDLQLPLTEVDKGNAIHGLVRWGSWSAVESSTDAVVMAYRLLPQPGWAWSVDLTLAYRLTPGGLEVTAGAHNIDSRNCPWGAGFHPYLFAFGGTVDDLELTAPGATRYLSDDRSLPTGTESVAGSDLDFRTGRRIGDARLDVAFTDLARDDAGRAVVELASASPSADASPAGDTSPGGTPQRTRMWMDEGWTHLMIFTGDTLGDPGRRRQGLAVEPMTAPADMLRSGDGRLVLEPGQTWQATWGIVPGPLLYEEISARR